MAANSSSAIGGLGVDILLFSITAQFTIGTLGNSQGGIALIIHSTGEVVCPRKKFFAREEEFVTILSKWYFTLSRKFIQACFGD